MKNRSFLLIMIAAVLFTGCNLQSSPVPDTVSEDPPTVSVPEPLPTAIPVSPTDIPIVITRLFDHPSVALITLLTPTENSGSHPRFEWQAVPDSTRYSLWVKTENGETYWAWEGPETFVYLGGGSEPPSDDGAGPRLTRSMQWTVVAFNADGRVIGSSEVVTISP